MNIDIMYIKFCLQNVNQMFGRKHGTVKFMFYSL